MTPEERTASIEPSILTIEGNLFKFLEPECSEFGLLSIAHALGNICRFQGHCTEFYSVAQHCVLLSYIVPPRFALEGLMHEAGEPFMGDMPAPLKKLFPEYRVMEKHIEAIVLQRFGLDPVLPPCIKEADFVMLATEQRDLMIHNDGAEMWTSIRDVTPLPERIFPWSPSHARDMFLDRYRELRDERNVQITDALRHAYIGRLP